MRLRNEERYTLKALGNPRGRGNKAAAPYYLTEALAQRPNKRLWSVFASPCALGAHGIHANISACGTLQLYTNSI